MYVNEQFAPNISQRVMLWLGKYWVNSKTSQLDIWMI